MTEILVDTPEPHSLQRPLNRTRWLFLSSEPRLRRGLRQPALHRLPHFHIGFSRFTERGRAFFRRLAFPVEDPSAIGAEMEVI